MNNLKQMKFKCSLCNYSSDVRKSVDRHINKKIKCGEGEANVVVLTTNICCEFCNRTMSTKPNLIRHLKICKVKKDNIEKELELEKQKNKELEKKVEILEAVANKPTIGIQNNLILNLTAYNNPNLDDIEKHLKVAAKKLFLGVPTIIEKIHFNNDKPKNHNMCIKNARTKLAKVFNGKQWTTMDEEDLIDELVDTYEMLLQEHSLRYTDKMDEIKTRDTEDKVYADMKTEVKKVLYDNRGMIKIKN